MKLVYLKIFEQFRSLQAGFEVNFRNPNTYSIEDLSGFHPFCLAGLNGSGKSNVLEALSSIFYHLECCANKFKPEIFQKYFKTNENSPSAYELEYLIGLNNGDPYILKNFHKVRITKEVDKAPVMITKPYPFGDLDEWENHNIVAEIGNEAAYGKQFLPDLVVAYSSGENEILSLPFVKMRLFQFDEYIQSINNREEYEEPESSLLYIDYEMSQSVLLANFLFQNEITLLPLIDELKIKGMNRFRINLNNHLLNDEQSRKNIKPYILEQLERKIEKLKSCATCYFENKQEIILDFLVNEATKEAFIANFKDAFDLFRFFQIAQVLNYRIVNNGIKQQVYQSNGYYTDGKLPEAPPDDLTFFFTDYFIYKEDKNSNSTSKFLLKNLSDGEQQFLHTIGICMMLQNRRTLLLLDEPETHFNPDWRSKFINILRKTLGTGSENFMLKDIVLTSHSPFIISDCLPDKAILFRKSSTGIEAINAKQLNFNTFGASVEYILQRFFGIQNLISTYSFETLKEIIKYGTEDDLRFATEFFGESSAKQYLYSELHKRTKNKKDAD